VYRFAAAYNTWRLIGRSNGVPAGTYGGNKTPVQITIDATGIISRIENKPIPPATLTSSGLMQAGIGLGVADNQGLVNVIPPTASNIGGVKAGPNVNIDPTGIISVPDSSFVTKGVVKLNDTLTSTSVSEALTAAKGKQLQDEINALRFNSLIFCGIYNASTSSLDYVTSEGASKGFVKGDNIPTPQESLNGCFVIVSRSGTPQPPAPQQLLESGDWLLIDTDPLQWVDIPIGRSIVAQQIEFTPVPNLPETNVQDAIAYIQLELDDIQIYTGEGLVGGPISRYGTISLAPPTKTTIGGVKAGPNIVISADGLISVQSGGNVGTVTEIRTTSGITGGPITTTGEISLADSPVIPGFYKYASVAVDQKGRLVSAVKGDDPVLVKDYLNKGDLLVGSGAGVYTQFPIGSNGQVLAVDVTTPSGLKWTNESPTGVTEVNTGEGLTGGPITSTGVISLTNTSVTPGSYTNANITVDAQGRITAAGNGNVSGGTVTSVTAGTGLLGGTITSSGTISLSPATTGALGGVIPDGTTITVQPDGTITAVSGGVGTLQEVTDNGATTDNTVDFLIPGSSPALSAIQIDPLSGKISVFPQGPNDSGLYVTPNAVFFGNSTGILSATGLYPLGIRFNGSLGMELYTTSSANAPIRIRPGDTADTVTFGTTSTTITTPVTIDRAGQLGSPNLTLRPGGNGKAISIHGNGIIEFLSPSGGQYYASIVPGVEYLDLAVANGGTVVRIGSLTTDITNQLVASGIAYPTTDGTAGQVLSTNGASDIGWLTTAEVVAAPASSNTPGKEGQIAFGTGFFYWHDGTEWLRASGTPF
jgi:hypothetical protein